MKPIYHFEHEFLPLNLDSGSKAHKLIRVTHTPTGVNAEVEYFESFEDVSMFSPLTLKSHKASRKARTKALNLLHKKLKKLNK